MFSLKDLNELLDKMPFWKRIKESPDRIDALEKRLGTLENRLSGTGNICPKCKEPKFQLINQSGGKFNYECSACNYRERTATRIQ